MKILLIAPPIDTCYENVLPIGLMNLYLVCRALGCEADFIDFTIQDYRKALGRALSKRYDLVGISCNFTNAVPYCIPLALKIKERYPQTLVISGGNHATLAPEDLLGRGYDYIVCGEGESTFSHLIQNLREGKSVVDLKGVCYRQGGRIVKNPPREPIEDLDTLPLNDYSQFDLKPYFERSGIRYANFETSRGCLYNCAFCSTVKIWGHRVRRKSARRVMEEFKVAKRLALDFVFIQDDDAALEEERLREFCSLMIEEGAVVPWGMTAGSSSIKNQKTFSLMAASGCIKVNICVESANPRILKAYRKPYTVEDNRRMCRSLLSNNILVHNHGIIGFPGETIRETVNTYLYLMRTSPMWHVSILEPRPGTDYWQHWGGKGDLSQYRLFGKANVILSRKKASNYLLYRFFALLYFLSPIRIWTMLFHGVRAVRYSYRIQYYVAYRTLKANCVSAFLAPISYVKKLVNLPGRRETGGKRGKGDG